MISVVTVVCVAINNYVLFRGALIILPSLHTHKIFFCLLIISNGAGVILCLRRAWRDSPQPGPESKPLIPKWRLFAITAILPIIHSAGSLSPLCDMHGVVASPTCDRGNVLAGFFYSK